MGRILLAVKQAHSEARLLAPGTGYQKNRKMRMKVALIALAGLAAVSIGAPVPEADPEAFVNLGAVAIPAITGSALIDGLLLGKVAFLKAAILANLLLGAGSADELADSAASSDAAYVAPQDDYGVPYEPPVNSYGAPAVSYEEPAPAVADTYGSPAADPLPSYGAPPRY